MQSGITQEYLLERYSYNPDTGELVHRRNGGVPAGTVAGVVYEEGYRRLKINGKKFMAHRLIWMMVYGEWPSITDHINRDKDDNRLANLREVSSSESNSNRKTRTKWGEGTSERTMKRRRKCLYG